MAVIKRTWTNPLIHSLRGSDSGAVKTIFESLTEYLRGHIGVWGNVSGTTDANGDFTITHNAGFIPQAILLTEQDAGDVTKMGPFHLETTTETSMVVHFFDKNGNDRVSHNVKVHYLVLPPTPIIQ